ncbi:peptidoglycan-binding protein [Streptomyces sp. NPDC059215]|uniref:peptidoglycan-binding protein n=1 Tax=Streptomyces sp. NPDC059215 TaxID=3346772 RepID=UPI0036A2A039
METPVFEEFDPASDCDCPGCARVRRFPIPSALPGPAARTAARKALVIGAAAGAALVALAPVPAVAAAHAPARPGDPPGDEPDTPQGGEAPLHGPAGGPAKPGTGAVAPATTRAAIINRAKKWITAQVPYSMSAYWSDGYRQDCSGYVSMAWDLPGNEWTGSLDTFGVRISRDQLEPGDILLFHNPADPQNGSHVVLFGGWTDYTHTYYIAYEQTRPYTRRQATPYAYWSNSARYVPYRHKGLADGTGGAQPTVPGTKTPYPGRTAFGPGANNAYVTQLGRLLVARGGRRFYTSGPGPRWTNADRRATQAFQLAQGWKGAGADGLPGPLTWSYLVEGKGKDIPPAAGTASAAATASTASAAGTAGAVSAAGAVNTAGTARTVSAAGNASTASTAGAAGKASTASTAGAAGRASTAGAVSAVSAVKAVSVTSAASAAPPAVVPGFPGRGTFRPGSHDAYVTLLGRQLVKRGFGAFYATGPGPDWGESDRRAVEAFQRAQGWRGGAADGFPGPETWRRLFS